MIYFGILMLGVQIAVAIAFGAERIASAIEKKGKRK